MDVAAAARAWIDAWSRAWPARDAELLEPVYAQDAVFRSLPSREPQAPADYARWAFADDDERLVELRFGEPVLGGSEAAIEYWAVLRRRDGSDVTLAGVALIWFGEDGRVVEQRDYWELIEGRHPPNFP
jgi:ketosteroid isomerase-like protein